MSPKAFEFPPYAVRKLRLRQITRQQVRRSWHSGVEQHYVTFQGQTRQAKHLRIGRRTLRVAYIESAIKVRSITAYWYGEDDPV